MQKARDGSWLAARTRRPTPPSSSSSGSPARGSSAGSSRWKSESQPCSLGGVSLWLAMSLQQKVFFSNMRTAYHCIKTKEIDTKFGYNSNRTDSIWTKPASQLNTTRKINSHMNYSHLAQPKRLALSVALSQCSIPWRESSRSCSSTMETSPAMRPHGAVEVRERNYPPLPPPKPPRAEARQPH